MPCAVETGLCDEIVGGGDHAFERSAASGLPGKSHARRGNRLVGPGGGLRLRSLREKLDWNVNANSNIERKEATSQGFWDLNSRCRRTPRSPQPGKTTVD